MMLKRAVLIAGLVVVSGVCLGEHTTGLVPREPREKTPDWRLQIPQDATGRLIVKFMDDVRARVSSQGVLHALSNQRVDTARDVLQRHDAYIYPLIDKPPQRLRAIEQRAEDTSGKAQPDLAGMMYVEGPRADLEVLARTLNGLENVEWVEFERYKYTAQGTGKPEAIPFRRPSYVRLDGVENYDPSIIEAQMPKQSVGTSARHRRSLPSVAPAPAQIARSMHRGEDPDCGVGGTGDCFDPANGSAFCEDLACCELVCEIDEFCCDEDFGLWDEFCVALANAFCQVPDPLQRCLVPWNGSCYEFHFGGGCKNQECCEDVCTVEPFCCSVRWDNYCVELANEICAGFDDEGPTPNLTPIQGYLTSDTYEEIPDELQPFIPLNADGTGPLLGYDGRGWDMQALYDFGDELIEDFGIDRFGQGNLTRGKTIKVGVIEWAYWGPEPFTDLNGNGEYDPGEPFSDLHGDGAWDEGHEDLDVNLEPGQTLIQIAELTEPDHATACLGIIGATENEFGVTGVAPDCELWFFPLTSVEEGPREPAAWTSMLETFGPGDVVSTSYGPGGPATNATVEPTFTFINVASDLGITVCISAGNDCSNLDNGNDLGSSGVVCVGACSPGFPYYRLAFSNYHEGGIVGENSNMVHVAAWGDAVAATGYGDVFQGDGVPTRSYTGVFNGTSAAAPQIAGLVACAQGLVKQFYGIPFSPSNIRSILNSGAFPQGGGPSPGRFRGGFDPTFGCALDLDPDAGPFYICPADPLTRPCYPRTTGDFSSMVGSVLNHTGFEDAPLVQDIYVLQGDLMVGNKFSVKGNDEVYFVVESEFVERNETPGGLGQIPIPQAAEVNYLATGDITDVIVVAESDVEQIEAIDITTQVQFPGGVTTLLFIEMYDWQLGDWRFVDVITALDQCGTEDGSGDSICVSSPSGPASLVRQSDDRMLLRMWTLGFTFSGGIGGIGGQGGEPDYRFRIDLVDIDVVDEGGGQDP